MARHWSSLLQFRRSSVSASDGINALRDKSSIFRELQEHPHMISVKALTVL
jgi:hypothetical protein